MTMPYGAKTKKPFCDPASAMPCVTVCAPRPGCSCDCGAVRNALIDELARRSLRHVTLGTLKVGCQRGCATGPFLGFPQRGFFYLRVTPEMIPLVVEETLVHGRLIFPRLSLNTDRSFRADLYFEKETGLLAAIDQHISMVGVARYFLDLEDKMSCSKCVPCRVGIKNLYESMDRIVGGEGSVDDVQEMEAICRAMIDDPKCVVPAAGIKPVLSALTLFTDEFMSVVGPSRPKAAPVEVLPPVVEDSPSESVVAQADETLEPPVPESAAEVLDAGAAMPVDELPVTSAPDEVEPVDARASDVTGIEDAGETGAEPAVETSPPETLAPAPEAVQGPAPVAADEPPGPVDAPEPSSSSASPDATSEGEVIEEPPVPRPQAVEEAVALPARTEDSPVVEASSEPPARAKKVGKAPAPTDKSAKTAKTKTKKEKPRKQKKGSESRNRSGSPKGTPSS